MGEDFMENWYTAGDRLYAQWAQPKVSETHTDFPNIPMFDLSTGEYSSDYITARGWEGGTSGNITDRDAYYKTLFQMHTDKLDEYDFSKTHDWEMFSAGYGDNPRFMPGGEGEDPTLVSPYKLKMHSTAKDWDISKILKFYETYPGTPLYQNTPSVEEEIIESLKTMDEVPIQGDE